MFRLWLLKSAARLALDLAHQTRYIRAATAQDSRLHPYIERAARAVPFNACEGFKSQLILTAAILGIGTAPTLRHGRRGKDTTALAGNIKQGNARK